MDELIVQNEHSLIWKPAVVSFPDFEKLKFQAMEIQEYLKNVEVNEDNIKIAKKDVADARKVIAQLDDQRKLIKREILQDYVAFENQVKELKAIVDEGDAFVRLQIRELEQKERDEKEEQLRELFARRLTQYELKSIPNLFQKWIKPSHLNKSTTLKKCEAEMTEFLERVQKDVEYLAENQPDALTDYIPCLDLRFALDAANKRAKTTEQAKALVKEQIDVGTIEKEMESHFVVSGELDIQLVKRFMINNGIHFRVFD